MRGLVLIGLLALPIHAADAPVPVKEAAGKFRMPPGFQATLFAGEPDVVQPIAFTFDDRGRMWVVECVMYPKWSQDGTGGKDRVIILEDTNGDGVHDKKTVVIDNGVNLSGIEWGFGGIYLCASPYLIHVPIDGKDKPGKPEILLDGWNIKDTKHNIFNSLIWGPDGWLYGCNGIQAKSYVGTPGTPKEKRPFFDCGVWRFHPTKKVFEVVANGTTNPFGLDFDEHGEMFITNCVIDHLFHIAPGGHYTRMYGNDPNPHVYGYMGSCVDYRHWGTGNWTDSRADQKTGALKKEHDDAGGGHAHAGCMIYLGENFPREYRNTLFTCNIHGNRLNNDGLERTSTGMKGVRRPDFLFANDPWFRGICVKQGPAGEMFVSDWCDTGECHNYQVAHTGSGRIYRVTHGELKPWTGDLSKWSDKDLVQALISPNEWLARKARRILQEREPMRDSASAADAILALSWEQSKPIVRNYERKVWAIAAIGRLDASTYAALKKEDYSNGWLLRLGVEAGVPQAIDDFKTALLDTRDVAGRLKLASLFGKLPERWKMEYAGILPSASEDRNLSWMEWFALEPLVRGPRGVNLLLHTQQPFHARNIARKLMTNAAEFGDQRDVFFVTICRGISKDENLNHAVLLGVRDALADQIHVKKPADWDKFDFSNRRADIREIIDDIELKFGDPAVITRLTERAKNGEPRAIALLAGRRTPGFEKVLIPLLENVKVRQAAIIGLANYNDPNTPKLILEIYAKLSPEEKADAVTTLASRATYAHALLDAVEKGTIPKTDVTAFTARQIAALKDKDVVAKLEKVWGKVQPASANRKALMDKYKAMLTPDAIAQADAMQGKAIFIKNCGTCHKMFGEGQNVGPELTGSQRSNLDYILENVVDPSAAVAREYQMTNYYLVDGRIVAGIVRQETPNSVTVRTVNEEVVIPKADIESKKATTLSVMPEGLLDVLKPEDVRNLVKFLMSKEPVKSP